MTSRIFRLRAGSTGARIIATRGRAAEAGYRLVLGARRADRLAELAEELGGEERAVAVRCDVTEWEDQQALAAAAIERFGRLDAAFANAGHGARRGFLEDSVEHWRSLVLTNVLGVALTIRATLPVLLEAGRGHVLLTGSVAGRRAVVGSLYSATKWAVGAIGESLRQELRQVHENSTIRVTLIEPGVTDTALFDNRPRNALSDDDIARAVIWALEQPESVDVNEILIRPTAQRN
jgi:NADP-dependent 3-hydroxy acid dehydrogenase YdfG